MLVNAHQHLKHPVRSTVTGNQARNEGSGRCSVKSSTVILEGKIPESELSDRLSSSEIPREPRSRFSVPCRLRIALSTCSHSTLIFRSQEKKPYREESSPLSGRSFTLGANLR
jgi:hypothetical protein